MTPFFGICTCAKSQARQDEHPSTVTGWYHWGKQRNDCQVSFDIKFEITISFFFYTHYFFLPLISQCELDLFFSFAYFPCFPGLIRTPPRPVHSLVFRLQPKRALNILGLQRRTLSIPFSPRHIYPNEMCSSTKCAALVCSKSATVSKVRTTYSSASMWYF